MHARRLSRPSRPALVALAALLLGAAPSRASTFSLSGPTSGTCSNVTFTVSRDGDTTEAETVSFRTAALSAFPGQHFVSTNGTLSFAAGETSRTVSVTERSPDADAFRYQTGARSYRLEVLDSYGEFLAGAEKTIEYGPAYTVPASGAFGEKSLAVLSGEITVTDAGFGQAYHPAPVESYFASAGPKGYFLSVGAQLRMTLDLQAKEIVDGYQHVQILANRATDEFDTIQDDDAGTPGKSRYLACFSHDQKGLDGTFAGYTFPVTTIGDEGGAEKPWSGNTVGDLRGQNFNSGCRASDGRLVVPTGLESLIVRFDASGKDEDDWTVGSVVARIQAVDATAPTLLASDIAVSPGPYFYGNTYHVSLPFGEIVEVTNPPTLTTSWGTLDYEGGSGGNVLTFVGTIAKNAPGAPLSVTGLSGDVLDLAGNAFSGPMGFDVPGAVIQNPSVYPIRYDLDGGTLPPDAPRSYTRGTATVLVAPARTGYTFAGWTGYNGNEPQTSVTIPIGTWGNVSYTAHWTPIRYSVRFDPNGGKGSMADQAFVYDAAQHLATNAFARARHVFAGWSTNANGAALYADGASVSNLAATAGAVVPLYAQWTGSSALFYPDDTEIADAAILAWIASYGAGQAHIDALGTNEKVGEAFLLNLDPTKACTAELKVSSIRVEDGMAYVGVALTRTENNVPVGMRKINGTLKLLGRADLATGSFEPLQPDDYDSHFETGNNVGIEYELPASNPPALFEAVVE